MKVLFLLTLCVGGAWAGENAILTTGFKIHVQSHSVAGDLVQLKTDTGVIELPAGAVAAFEKEEYTPPPPAPVKAPETVTIATTENAATTGRQLTPLELIEGAARRAQLPPALVRSIAKAESAYHVNALSPKGAIGLMQLMPATAAALNADPRDPRQNAEAGAMYLRELLIRYQDDDHQVSKAVAAYNAGPGAVDRFHGIPPYRETINYVKRVLREYEKRSPVPATD